MAQKEAERERAEAELHQERATMHERGEADHELIDEHERDKFAGTSADPDGTMAEQPRRASSTRAARSATRRRRDGDGRFTREAREDQAVDAPGSPPRVAADDR